MVTDAARRPFGERPLGRRRSPLLQGDSTAVRKRSLVTVPNPPLQLGIKSSKIGQIRVPV
eukprot:6710278-Prymnesium_polylepis.1